jgi:hypothetical protein
MFSFAPSFVGSPFIVTSLVGFGVVIDLEIAYKLSWSSTHRSQKKTISLVLFAIDQTLSLGRDDLFLKKKHTCVFPPSQRKKQW